MISVYDASGRFCGIRATRRDGGLWSGNGLIGNGGTEEDDNEEPTVEMTS